jgi:putative transposase
MKMYKIWTPKLRRHIINQWRLGITPISDIARCRKVPRRTVYYLIEKYKKGGYEALEPEPKGRKKIELNPVFIELIKAEYHKYKFGSYKMWLRMKSKGFSVSQRKIQEIYNKEGFRINTRSRPSQIKYIRYEYASPHDLWHTDWTTCPFTKKQMIAFIDDCTRVLIHAEYFAHATTENSILAFANAIERWGKPKAVLTDNGTQFTPARADKGPFTQWCEKSQIKHILGRIHHPQTNGKIERWFGTYKQEYDERFTNIDQFLKFYNEERPHMSIGYLTPMEKLRKCANNSV